MFRRVIEMAEKSFRANFATTDRWKRASEGTALELVSDADLTDRALPFWTLGWNIARTVSLFPSDLARYVQGPWSLRQSDVFRRFWWLPRGALRVPAGNAKLPESFRECSSRKPGMTLTGGCCNVYKIKRVLG